MKKDDKSNPINASAMNEMLEMGQALQAHDLMSDQDLLRLKRVCQTQPEGTPERQAQA